MPGTLIVSATQSGFATRDDWKGKLQIRQQEKGTLLYAGLFGKMHNGFDGFSRD